MDGGRQADSPVVMTNKPNPGQNTRWEPQTKQLSLDRLLPQRIWHSGVAASKPAPPATTPSPIPVTHHLSPVTRSPLPTPTSAVEETATTAWQQQHSSSSSSNNNNNNNNNNGLGGAKVCYFSFKSVLKLFCTT